MRKSFHNYTVARQNMGNKSSYKRIVDRYSMFIFRISAISCYSDMGQEFEILGTLVQLFNYASYYSNRHKNWNEIIDK